MRSINCVRILQQVKKTGRARVHKADGRTALEQRLAASRQEGAACHSSVSADQVPEGAPCFFMKITVWSMENDIFGLLSSKWDFWE
jgi:hypothetical protein